MQFCNYCGEKLVDGARYCHMCGLEITDKNEVSKGGVSEKLYQLRRKWDEIVDKLDVLTNPKETWLRPMKVFFVDENRHVVVFKVVNDMAKVIIESRYIRIINDAIEELFGEKYEVEVVVE